MGTASRRAVFMSDCEPRRWVVRCQDARPRALATPKLLERNLRLRSTGANERAWLKQANS